MKYLFLLTLMPTFLYAQTDFAKACLKAKEAFDIHAKLEDFNTWSEDVSSNGYEEWGVKAKCIKSLEKDSLIVLKVESWGPFGGDEKKGCELYDAFYSRRLGTINYKICEQ